MADMKLLDAYAKNSCDNHRDKFLYQMTVSCVESAILG